MVSFALTNTIGSGSQTTQVLIKILFASFAMKKRKPQMSCIDMMHQAPASDIYTFATFFALDPLNADLLL